jgi:hypothetical protein
MKSSSMFGRNYDVRFVASFDGGSAGPGQRVVHASSVSHATGVFKASMKHADTLVIHSVTLAV